METLFDKVKSEESRINRELTDHARTRIVNTLDFHYTSRRDAYRSLKKESWRYTHT